MTDKLERYKKVDYPLPNEMLIWPLYGAGLENLGEDDKPITVPVPQYGPDELLVRHDAVGLCFSDMKIIRLGPDHPRILGRDMQKNPVIMGHEVALTVVGVGENLKDQYKVGDRFVIQADIYYEGKNLAYGYLIDGGLAQYNVVGKEILAGDDGCYLIPLKDETGYAEAGLTEPWACVERAYSVEYRRGLKPDGIAWFVGGKGEYTVSRGLDHKGHPRKIVTSAVPAPFRDYLREKAQRLGIEFVEWDELDYEQALAETEGRGFDDIVVLEANADAIEHASEHLARGGILAIVADEPLSRPVTIDIGRIHYDHRTYVGAGGSDVAQAYYTEIRCKLKPEGIAWFVGAGGPMGRMHVQRALESPQKPRRILATDISTTRLSDLGETFGPEAEAHGVELVCLNPAELEPEEYRARLSSLSEGRGFDDIVMLAPVPALTSEASGYLAPGGVLNVFAGLGRGTGAQVDLTIVYSAQQARIIGSTASTIDDLKSMLHKTETGELSPNRSVAAIAGLNGAKEGIVAMRDTVYPGKIVVFPQLTDLELTALPDLKDVLPGVYAKLKNGREWTPEAEEELLREKLKI